MNTDQYWLEFWYHYHIAVILLVVSLILAAIVLAAFTGMIEAYLDVRARPKEEMEWCHKHGYFRKKHCLVFMGVTVCPMCYKDSWDKAEERR